MKRGVLRLVLANAVVFAALSITMSAAQAISSGSSSYKFNGTIDGSFGGRQGSTNYTMQSTGGESIVGNAAGGSYKITEGYTAQLNKSLQLVVQQGGLVAYWPLDNVIAGGTAFDASSNANNGKISAGSQSEPGVVNSAWGDTSAAQSITIPDSPTFPSSNKMTISGWFARSNNTSDRGIIAKWDFTSSPNTHGSWALEDTAGGAQLRFYMRNGDDYATNYIDTTNANISAYTAYHFAVVYDGTQPNANRVTIYLNGTKLTTAVTGTLPTAIASAGGDAAVIGNVQGLDYGWSGLLDEIKIFNRTLSSGEVKSEYTAGSAGIPSGLSVGNVTPGVSQTEPFDAVVRTDAPGYTIGVNQNNNLTSGSNSVPSVSGTIASPVTWNEGSTKGLGFSLYGASATAIAGKWNNGSSYAALPASNTSFYTRSGLSGGIKDTVNLRLRLDVAASQPVGDYANQAIFSGTMTP